MNVAVLVDIIKETKTNWRFIFESPLYESINFVPGQLVQLLAKPYAPSEGGDSIQRNYSVASWPDGSNKFELIITYLKGGKMSEYLFNEVKIGDEFAYKGPMGIFTLPKEINRDIFFVATGSGVSPFRSMLGHIATNKVPTKNIKLFFGTRTKEDIPYYDEMKMYEEIIPNFEFVPCLSREKWEGHNGYVHTAYLPELTIMDDKPLVYYCGWDKMISEGRFYLDELGFKMMEDIRVEIFG
jgi:CDP-4-dehydro-6-deoxyglucose reductase